MQERQFSLYSRQEELHFGSINLHTAASRLWVRPLVSTEVQTIGNSMVYEVHISWSSQTWKNLIFLSSPALNRSSPFGWNSKDRMAALLGSWWLTSLRRVAWSKSAGRTWLLPRRLEAPCSKSLRTELLSAMQYWVGLEIFGAGPLPTYPALTHNVQLQ